MIGVFDSGVGGLSVLRELLKVLPGECFAYYADTANCPYGGKGAEFVTERAREITEFLLLEGAEIIVIACNTATSAAIETLRAEYSDATNTAVREKVLRLSGGRQDHIMFIGLEPALKQAVGMTKNEIVGVLATAGTLAGERYQKLRARYASEVTVVEHVGEGFVEMVESGEADERRVAASVGPLLAAGADTLVLGCTHYPFLIEPIRKAAATLAPQREVAIVDPAPAVAARLLTVMKSEGLCSQDKTTTCPASSPSLPSPDSQPSSQSTKPSSQTSTAPSSSPNVRLYSSGDTAPLLDFYNSAIQIPGKNII